MGTLSWIGLRGRDGSQVNDLEIPADRAREMVNVDLYRTSFARKRGGSLLVATTGGTAFSGTLNALHAFVPGADLTAAQLFASDTAFVWKRLNAGTAWANVTLKDAQNVQALPVSATFNGKLFLAYPSAVSRLHVWDGTTVRRVGLDKAGAPTVANTGAGTYAATLRYYKVAAATQSGGVTVRRGELSNATSFTPSGTGTAARVTYVATGDDESHWEVYGSADNDVFYRLATTAIATLTYDDSAAPSSYGDNTAAPTVGVNVLPIEVRYLLAVTNRLLLAGDYNNTYNSRVWYTPVLGSSGVGDDERIPDTTTLKNYIDLDENDGGYITGLGGPLEGYPFVFKYAQIWRLIPTGDVDVPYVPRALQKGSGIGAVSHESIVMAEDEAGRAALYFWSPIGGCYRIGANGLQYCGRDNEDITLSLAGTQSVVFGVYYPAKRQIWYWVNTAGGADCDTLLVFDTRKGRDVGGGEVRGGWTQFTGGIAAARCAVLFANTLGTAMSRDRKPYIGRTASTHLWKGDTGTDDNSTAYLAYVDLPTRHPAGIDQNVTIGNPRVLASADGQVLRCTLTADYDAVADRTDDETFTAAGSETRMAKTYEGLEGADISAVQLRVGDDQARSNSWVIDAVVLPYEPREDV